LVLVALHALETSHPGAACAAGSLG
jgi:hypothetical protein